MINIGQFVYRYLGVRWLLKNRWVALVHLTMRDFSRSNGPNVAAGVSYFALFSIFPLALAAITISGFLFATKPEQLDLVRDIQELIPVSTDFLSDIIEGVVNSRGPVSLIAAAGFIWSGLAVFSSLRKAINHAWGIGKPPNLLKERLIDLSMALGVGLAAAVVILLSAAFFETPKIGEWISVIAGGVFAKILAAMLSLLVTFLVLLLMYKFVPNRKVPWGDVWLAAIIGAVFFEGGKMAIAWYFSEFGAFNLVYGSLGGLMVILVWIYVSALIVLIAAQLSAVYSRTIGSDHKAGRTGAVAYR